MPHRLLICKTEYNSAEQKSHKAVFHICFSKITRSFNNKGTGQKFTLQYRGLVQEDVFEV
jgi:hypothetical protein